MNSYSSSKELGKAVKAFLIFGPNLPSDSFEEEGEEEKAPKSLLLSNIIAECNNLKCSYELIEKERAIFESRRNLMQQKVSKICNEIKQSPVMNEYRHYLDLQSTIQLMVLSNTLERLGNFSDVAEIPSLVLGVVDNIPKVVPPQSKIKKLLIETVSKTRSLLLKEFHQLFENHLQQSSSTMATDEKKSENMDMDMDVPSNLSKKGMWTNFLAIARDWLLAFSLVSILPIILTESKNLVIEKYQEALDEALTPMWGRFHFHLSSARESSSVDQILWTFGYAKSFVQLLIDLSSQINSAGHLQKLYPGNYQEAGTRQVVEKTLRFMRAHLAQTIVEQAIVLQSDIYLCITLVENSLDFDSTLRSMLPPPPLMSNSSFLPVSSVIYDAHKIFMKWVEIDQQFFLDEVIKISSSFSIQPYSFKFGFMNKNATGNYVHDSVGENDNNDGNNGQCRCYNILYECLSLFMLASKRYHLMPQQSQDSFSGAILEPFLCMSIAFLLIRIRSNPILNNISTGKTRKNYHHINDDNILRYSPPNELRELFDSVHYFQISIGAIESAIRSMNANPSRFEELWEDIHSWLPKQQISEEDIRLGTFSPTAVAKKVINIANTNNKRKDGGKSENEISSRSRYNLGYCIDLTRGQAITIAGTLDKKLRASYR